jgi:hypothetical protein
MAILFTKNCISASSAFGVELLLLSASDGAIV